MTSPSIQSCPKLFLPQLVDIPGAFPHSPAISNEETKTVAHYMEQDAKDHHVYFNDKGFHNHLVHILLADYSLGATSDRIHELYKQEAPIQRKKLSKHDDFKWNEHLGDENYYSDYLDFFIEEIKKLGRVGAIEKYAFDDKHNMLARFLGGAYHPLIHTGYGLEFGIDGMVAEGLAQTCVHDDETNVLTVTDEGWFASLLSKLSLSSNTESPLDIANAVYSDSRLDSVVKFDDVGFKFSLVLKRKPEVVLEHANKWHLPTTTEGLLEKARDLMRLAVAVYAGPQRPGKEVMFDFFLMHALTSALFLPSMVKSLSPNLAAKLLRGKLAVDLAYYVSRNRPKLHMERFHTSKEFTKSWSEIFDLTIKHNDEHVPKVIRALKQVERYDPEEIFGKGVYRAIASATIEYVGEVNKPPKRWWCHDAIGFDEVWKDIPDSK